MASTSTEQPVGTDVWVALVWCVGALVIAHTFAMLTYRPSPPADSQTR